MVLTPDIILGFTHAYLLNQYDKPQPTPDCHIEWWEMCGNLDEPKVAIAAPRGHAKSTAITHAFVLALVCLRLRSNVLILSSIEAISIGFLGDIKRELAENEPLREKFGIVKVFKDTETDVRVLCTDGHMFRLFVKGAEQKLRGTKWRGKRPDAVICDDLEDDETVMNPDRRRKFRKWFYNALLPVGSDDCIFRIVGTILHLDSMLNRILGNRHWLTKRFRAHAAFNDFSELLWPQKFTEERLRSIRQDFIEDGNPEGYAQEYLNDPIAEGETYFREQDFLPMEPSDFTAKKVYFAAADFAISEKEQADYTVIGAVGMDEHGVLHVEDIRRFRGDADEIISELLQIQKRYEPQNFTFETEKIDKAIGPSLNRAMMKAKVFLNIDKITPSKSKTTRGKSFQRMMKIGAVRWNKEADWYEECHAELMTVTPSGPRGKHDDYFDFVSYIGLSVDKYYEALSEEEQFEDDYEAQEDSFEINGVDYVTGY